MTQPSPSKTLVIICPEVCSLSPKRIGEGVSGVLLEMRQNGAGAPSMQKRASELLGFRVPISNMTRHVARHYRELAEERSQVVGPRPSDVGILDAIIEAGFRNSKSWKPSIKDTLDAMKLKTAMTGQSAFEDMLKAMEVGLDIADGEEAPENPEAIASADERGAPDADDAG